jgi:tetratricopeptide (TPR) repeat protein
MSFPALNSVCSNRVTPPFNLAERGILPGDPRLASIRMACRTSVAPIAPVKDGDLERQDIASKPTFDCTIAKSATARILCLDQAGANADWDLSSAYWARLFSLPENARDRFEQVHENWFPSLSRACDLQEGQSNFSFEQRQCVLNGFRRRADSYRSLLRGDALLESKLTPEQHVEIQQALIVRKYLDGHADGEFGPITRSAIKRFQVRSGFPEEFLTVEQHEALVQPEKRLPPVDLPPPADARVQCQSPDANKRLAGCTIIINAKGFGSTNNLADAFDGRCWAYNDLQQYDRGVADCKASIALNSKYSYAYNNLGVSYFGFGDLSNALIAVAKAIELKPNFIYSRLNRAKIFIAFGKKDLGRKDLEFALTIDPENLEVKEAISALGPPPETPTLKEARLF